MKNKLLPQKLKELRKVNNYTQDYVAEVLGVPQIILSDKEHLRCTVIFFPSKEKSQYDVTLPDEKRITGMPCLN